MSRFFEVAISVILNGLVVAGFIAAVARIAPLA